MLQMLGAVAEFERSLIRERVASGLARAARQGRRGGNPALRARDPDALRRLRHAREDAYRAKVMAGARQWLPTVIRLRTEEGRTWEHVVRAVNAGLAGSRPGGNSGDRAAWSQARLVRAVRALVRDGLAPAEILQGRGRARTRASGERDAALRAVAAILEASRRRRCGPSPSASPACSCTHRAAARSGPPPPWPTSSSRPKPRGCCGRAQARSSVAGRYSGLG